MLTDLMNRHARAALMFSGGKDSLACLHLARLWWGRIDVLWINTGANLPEIVSVMDRVRAEVPNFIEIRSDQAGNLKAWGLPVDVLPINATAFGQACTGPKSVALRSYLDCCAQNLWAPTAKALDALGATAVIKGQRRDESHTVPHQNSSSSIEVCLPINDWTSAQVLSYLQEQGEVIDDRLRLGHSSLDCWSCTAYLGATADRRAYMKKHHPERAHQVLLMLDQIGKTLNAEVQGLCDALTEE